MLFNSFPFAGFLLMLVGLLSLPLGARARLLILILGSYAFYGAWDPRFVPLLIVYTAIGWFAGLLIHRARSQQARRVMLVGGVGLSLAGLAFFKYAAFLAETITALLGLPSMGTLDIVLPVGISFFTFEVISYLVDIHRREAEPSRDVLQFALFMAFFPRLVAGPIIRASDFLPQAQRPIAFDRNNLLVGARMVLTGLVLKVLCADNLSVFVDAVHADAGAYSAGTLAFAAVCYSFQIFGDFAGYSLMGIGIARGFGFRLPPNFDMPYAAASIADFWRRWHISLSSWLRDYLYISLGGSRRSGIRTLVNLTVTMVLGGLWHGASWNFVLWGLLHGLALVAHRLWSGSALGRGAAARFGAAYTALGWMATFVLVTALWVPFRSLDFSATRLFFERILSGADGIVWIHTPSLAIVLGMTAWHLVEPVLPCLRKALVPFAETPAVLAAGLAVLMLLLFGQQNASPFIYFQF